MFWLNDRNRPPGDGGFSSAGTWEIFTLCMRSAPSEQRICQYPGPGERKTGNEGQVRYDGPELELRTVTSKSMDWPAA